MEYLVLIILVVVVKLESLYDGMLYWKYSFK